ncbi:MAG: primosomal protein N' [Elusimicrobia bacterium]|nr:primosomal protein N' [Elusimicrobiota bacterium]
MRIAEVAFPVPLHRGFHYQVPEDLPVSPGMRVRAPFGPRRAVGTVLCVFEGEPERKLKALEASLEAEPALTPELLEAAVWISRRYAAPIGECVKAVLPSFIKQPLPGGALSFPAVRESAGKGFTLTASQSRALDSLAERLKERKPHVSLLYGVPASGKTEVYLRLIRQAVSRQGQVLFLLPEIALTAPFFGEFQAALEVPVVLWHSEIPVRQRRQAWWGLRMGQVRVVVGARSACLLPFQDLRLVVIDEEQDESFKQEGQSPLYHAREVAIERARRFAALAVLGSATPSLESWERARRGDWELLPMPERVSGVPRPAVQVVAKPKAGCLSEELVEKIKERLKNREQSILLVNRRGFSTLVMCGKCGWVDRCSSCGVAKIQHQNPEGGYWLVCHHCSRKSDFRAECSRCKAQALRVSGVGTQKVVAELKARLPGTRVLRMDRDTVSKEGSAESRLYERFKAGEADILVGTKLVAKSFHFPEVTLVGVVDADTMIHMPDFRASERTMQLLAQVAGRSGRAEKKGEVLLQTLEPDHIAILGTLNGDYAAFAEAELGSRRELGYPPFSILLRALWSGARQEDVEQAARDCARRLRDELGLGERVLGPAPAVVRLALGKFRFHILLKLSEAELGRALAWLGAYPAPTGSKLRLNVDPYDLF